MSRAFRDALVFIEMKIGFKFLTTGALAALATTAAFAQVATGDDDILNRLKGQSYAPNVVVVSFHDAIGPMVADSVIKSAGLVVDENVRSQYFVRLLIPQTGRARMSVIDTIKWLRLNPAVRIAEPDMKIYPDGIPNDAGFGNQWGMHNTGQSGGTVDADVDAPEAYDLIGGAPQVVVAVCDDGVDYNHPDLAGNTYVNPGEIPGNGIDDDGNGFIDDVRGWDFASNDNTPLPGGSHGTHVAGSVSAVVGNGIGAAGFGNNVKIMPIRHYSGQSTWMTALANGIDYAWQNGADVITVSYNIDGYTTVLVEAIQRAGAADVIYCNSAGNNGQNNPPRQNIRDVANNVIFVASTTRTDARSSFSNYGTKIEIGAPGSDIYSTLPNNSYGLNSGTSMATPHVAGAAAAVRGIFPALTARQVLDVLINASDPRPALQINGGRMNWNNALEVDNTAPNPVANLTATRRSATALQVHFNASGDDGNVGSASSYDIRVSSAPITAGNFASARKINVSLPIVPAGTQIDCTVNNLIPNEAVYVAVKAIDNMANSSSPVGMGPIQLKPAVWLDLVSGAPQFTPQGTWALTNSQSNTGGQSWTDSPAGNYGNNVNASLTSIPSVVPPGPAALRFFAKLALAASDFLIVETSTNGGPWVEQGRFGSTAEWNAYSVPMIGMNSQSVQFRFRMLTNASTVADGVYIDDIHVVNVLTPFSDNVEGAAQFSTQAPWATTTAQAFSPTRSWHDSPAGNYVNNLNIAITSLSNLGLSGIADPILTFMARYALETSYDYLNVESSPNSGGTYNLLGRLNGTNTTWTRQNFSLNNYDSAMIRFRLTTDTSVVLDGVYLDDIVVYGEPWENIRVVKGAVTLEQLLANPAGRQVEIQVRNLGNTTPLETIMVTLTGTGEYFAVTTQVGNYDLAFKGQMWLRKVVANVDTSTSLAVINASLVAGDANGDNRVDYQDDLVLRNAYLSTTGSPTWDPRADLTGNGVVDVDDFRILRRRMNRVGDD